MGSRSSTVIPKVEEETLREAFRGDERLMLACAWDDIVYILMTDHTRTPHLCNQDLLHCLPARNPRL